MSTPATSPAVRRPAYRLVRRRAVASPELLDDPLQRYVTEHTDGPLLVVGGPGTGKTTVLVEAVAARVAEGVDPERILVLTFGRRGSAALRDRIEARIAGDPGRIVHEPLVRTFHAYAFGLLRRAAAERGEPSPRLLTGPEQDLIIRELLSVVGDDEAADTIGWPDALRPALPTRAFAQQLRDLMQRAAERGVGPVQLARLGEQLGRDDWPAAARFLREYVAVLALRDATTRGSTAYDPAELVRAASGLLADDPALLAAERRRLSFVYVDELADTDPAQIELLSLVAGGGTPLVAFGDPDSSVYGFRGADPDAVVNFPTRFRTASGALAETLTLHTSYRAETVLLGATGRVARRMRGRVTHRHLHPPTTAEPAPDGAPGSPARSAEVPGARRGGGVPGGGPGKSVPGSGPVEVPSSRRGEVRPADVSAGHEPVAGTDENASAEDGRLPWPRPGEPLAAEQSERAPTAGETSGSAPGEPLAAEQGERAPTADETSGSAPGERAAAEPASGESPAVGGGASTADSGIAARPNEVVPGQRGEQPTTAPVAAVGDVGAGPSDSALGGAAAGPSDPVVGDVPTEAAGTLAGDATSGAAGSGVAAGLAAAAARRAAAAVEELPAGAVVRTFRTPTSESAFVAHALREAHLLHGVPWSRMAVILRSAAVQLPSMQRALVTAGVPTVTHAEDLPLHLQPAVAPFLLLLRCALDPEALDEEATVALLHSPLGGADPLAERRLRQGLRALALAAGDRRPSGELLVDAVRDPAGLDMVERRWAQPAQNVARLIATAREAAAAPNATAEQVLWTVWRESGLPERWYALSTRTIAISPDAEAGRARQWRAEAADRDLDAMVVLFDAAARFVDRLPGARTEVFLDHVLGQDLPADSIAPSADRGEAVRLLTAHAAKGLEWDVVVLAGVQEGIWPDLRLRGSLLGSERLVDVLAGRPASGRAAVVGETSALLDEERRLFYVAATRAKHRLIATAVASAGVGGADGEEQPSRFLSELALPEHRNDPGPPDDDVPDPDPPDPEPPDPGPGPPDDDRPEPVDPEPVDPEPVDPEPAGGPEPVDPDSADPDLEPESPGDEVATRAEHLDAALELPVARPPRALTLAALVAELRTVVVSAGETPSRRHAAAAELARLAAAGVPGAHPDEWWGLRTLSDDRPLVDDGDPVKVTPSSMESALRCSLRWLLERHGGSAPAGPAQGVGNLVHAAAMLAEDANADREQLVEYVSARFDAIELAARWLAGPEEERARDMVDKLLRWLAKNPRRLLAIEHEFTVRLNDEKRPIQLTGRVDRLEVDEQGRLVVIDLKTGKSSAVTASDVDEHAQLAGYQAAVDAGAFETFGGESGGAALVQLGPGKDAREQMQLPLAEAEDPAWAYAMVRRTADTMAAATFSAVANSRCRVCPVRTACPISGKGRQVVEPGPGPG